MAIWRGVLQRSTGLALAGIALISQTTNAGVFFNKSKSNCGCEGAPPSCYVECDQCQKPRKLKLCHCKEAPVAPVVQSIPAAMVNLAAIPAPPAQTQSEQLKLLRDMLVQTNQSIQNAQQSAAQQSAAATDAASIEQLKRQLDQLKISLDTLEKAIGEAKTNPGLLK